MAEVKNYNKLIIIVAIVCVTLIVVVSIFVFGLKNLGDIDSSSTSDDEQGGLMDFFKGLFTPKGNLSDTSLLPDDSEDEDDDSDTGVCGNTCAEGYNQNPFPDCSCYVTDSDGDGVGDNSDAFPNDPDETQDSDGDGVGDNEDYYPNDPDKTEPDCEDSDGGKNTDVKGTMKSGITDCCTEEGGGVCVLGSSGYVMEYFCTEDDEEDFEVIACDEGEMCSNGECVNRELTEIDTETTCQDSLSGGCNGYCGDGEWCTKFDDMGYEYCWCSNEKDDCSSYCSNLNAEWYDTGYPAHGEADCFSGELYYDGCCCDFGSSISQQDKTCYADAIPGLCRDGSGMCNYEAYCSPYTWYITCSFAEGGGFGSGGFTGEMCPTGGASREDPGQTSITCSCKFADGSTAETTTPVTVI